MLEFLVLWIVYVHLPEKIWQDFIDFHVLDIIIPFIFIVTIIFVISVVPIIFVILVIIVILILVFI